MGRFQQVPSKNDPLQSAAHDHSPAQEIGHDLRICAFALVFHVELLRHPIHKGRVMAPLLIIPMG